MTPVLIAILVTIVVGLPAALLLDRAASAGRAIGEGFLLGSGAVSLALLALSLAGIRWSLVSATAVILVFATICWAILLTRPHEEAGGGPGTAPSGSRWLALPADVVTALFVVGHAIYATGGSIPHWDFWAIWGLKARVFFLHGGIDWSYLRDPAHEFVHPDYPLLLPLNYVFASLLRGGWEDRWIGLLSTAFAAALLLIVRDLLRKELRSDVMAALGTLVLSGIALSSWVGLGEGPMIAFAGAGLLLVRAALAQGDRERLITLGSLFLGLAAFSKNEGQTLLVAAALAMAVARPGSRWRSVLRLWPALAVAVPWIALKLVHGLPNDLLAGGAAARAQAAMRQIGPVLGEIAALPSHRTLFWTAALVALLLGGLRTVERERFVLLAVVLQIGAYVAAYAVTPHDIVWQVTSSWHRLLAQMAVPLGFVALAALGRWVGGGEGGQPG